MANDSESRTHHQCSHVLQNEEARSEAKQDVVMNRRGYTLFGSA